MWWSRAILCLMVLAAGPVGCGFQPIYAKPGGAASSPMADQLAAIRIAGIDDRIGQQLRNSLVETLNPRGEPAAPRYLLTVRLTQSSQGLANSRDGNATVGRVTVTASYSLSGDDGRALFSGTTRAFGGFRYLGPRYASTVSERDSESSVVTEIGTEIRSALIAYFADPETFNRRETEARRQMLLQQQQQDQQIQQLQRPPLSDE